MLKVIELPNKRSINIYYTDKVYSPAYSAVDTIIVADMFLRDDGKVLDVATGSGVIALGLKRLNPKAEVYASDIDIKAVRIARHNSEALKLKIKVYANDLLEGETEKFDMVTTNLPTFDEEDMATQILHGPKIAYYADAEDGLAMYKKLIPELERVLHKEGVFVCECQMKYKDRLKEYALEQGWSVIMETDAALAFVRTSLL